MSEIIMLFSARKEVLLGDIEEIEKKYLHSLGNVALLLQSINIPLHTKKVYKSLTLNPFHCQGFLGWSLT